MSLYSGCFLILLNDWLKKVNKSKIICSVYLKLRDNLHAFARAKLTLYIDWAKAPRSSTHSLPCALLSRGFVTLGWAARCSQIGQLLHVQTVVHLHEAQLTLLLGHEVQVSANFFEHVVYDLFVHCVEHAWHSFEHAARGDLVDLTELHVEKHHHAYQCEHHIWVTKSESQLLTRHYLKVG